jgi:hypothetical protein
MSHSAFDYPALHVRRHAPAGYTQYAEYKPWLRDEFEFRCVYCLEREMWYPNRAAAFSVDHVIPQTTAPTRTCDYKNMVYACTRCNSAKRAVLTIDPTATAFSSHLRVRDDGTIESLTDEGQDIIDLLHLDEDPAEETRKKYLRIATLKSELPTNDHINQLFADAFGYPSDLPELRTKIPPKGNALKANVVLCYLARRENNTLPDVY